MDVIWKGAAVGNYGIGRFDPVTHKPVIADLIVLHWIVGSLASADKSFNTPGRKASATYGVGQKEVHQYVDEKNTPYSNGNSNPAKNTNPRSISIEHEGGWLLPDGTRAKPTSQVHELSSQLIVDIVKRNPVIKLGYNAKVLLTQTKIQLVV